MPVDRSGSGDIATSTTGNATTRSHVHCCAFFQVTAFGVCVFNGNCVFDCAAATVVRIGYDDDNHGHHHHHDDGNVRDGDDHIGAGRHDAPRAEVHECRARRDCDEKYALSWRDSLDRCTNIVVCVADDDEWLLPVSVAVSLSGLPYTFAYYADFFNNATDDDMQAHGTGNSELPWSEPLSPVCRNNVVL